MSCTFFYLPESGKIIQHIEPQLNYSPVGEEFLAIHTVGDASMIETHYVVDEEVMPRPIIPLTGGESVATGELWRIDGIPAGTQADYPGGSLVVDDGYIELSFAEPGEYTFKFSNFPYLEDVRIATITSV